jgi:hypothetical protein
MVKQENEIRERINELNTELRHNEEAYPSIRDPFIKNRILMQSFNIESQLYALHYVLGEEYVYKHI